MRKTLGIAAIALSLVSLPALAGGGAGHARRTNGTDQLARGTITSWDESTRTVHIAGPNGEDSVYHWNERTEVRGTPKVGEKIKLQFERDASGNLVARRIMAKDPSERKPSGERSLSRI